MEDLRLRIESGEWKAEEYLPSQTRLARDYGVSQTAITLAVRALQQEGLLRVIPKKGAFIPAASPQQTRPVLPIIGVRGSYVTPYSTGLATTQTIDQGNYSYTAAVLQAIWAAAQQEECSLLLLPSTEESRLTPQACHDLGIQGALFLGGETYQEALELRRAGFPVMTANPPSGFTPINFVDHDNGRCLRYALSYLISHGHRRIATLFPSTSSPDSFNQLKPHFIETLCAANLVYNFEDYWRFVPHPSADHDLATVTHELLDLPEAPTALFCFAGFQVTVVREVAEQRGLSIPQDLSVLYAPYDPTLQPATSGYMPRHDLLAKTLLRGLLETIRTPFHSVQELIPFHALTDHGTVRSF